MVWYNPISDLTNITNGLGITRPTGKTFRYGTDPRNQPGANSPYKSGWDALISQLQARANGETPSIAERQVRDVASAGMHQQLAMGAGRSAGAAREATLGASKITQGLENSAGQARIAEQQANQGALQNALSGASGNQFNYDQLAQQQAQFNASRPTGVQQLAGIASQIGGAAAGAGAFSRSAPGGSNSGLPGGPTTLAGAQFSQGQAPDTMPGNTQRTMPTAPTTIGPPIDPFEEAVGRRYRSPQGVNPYAASPFGPTY